MRTSSRSAAGFTIVEIAITVLVVGILAAVAAPNISGLFRQLRLRSAADSVKGLLYLAKSRAVANPGLWCGAYFDTTNRVCIVFFDKNATGRYDSSSDVVYKKSQSFHPSIRLRTFTSLDSQAVIFRGDGSTAKGGRVQVYGPAGTITFTVSKQIGLIHEE